MINIGEEVVRLDEVERPAKDNLMVRRLKTLDALERVSVGQLTVGELRILNLIWAEIDRRAGGAPSQYSVERLEAIAKRLGS